MTQPNPKELEDLRQQLSFLEQKLRMLESDSAQPDAADPAHLKGFWAQFGPNVQVASASSGSVPPPSAATPDLDLASFERFVRVLTGIEGEIAADDMRELLRDLTKSNESGVASVSFEQFLAWYQLDSIKSSSLLARQLHDDSKRFLASALVRRTLLRGLQRTNAAASRAKLRSSLTSSQNSAPISDSAQSVPGSPFFLLEPIGAANFDEKEANSTRTKLNVSLSTLKESNSQQQKPPLEFPCKVQLRYALDPALASKRIADFKVPTNAQSGIIVAFSFRTMPDINDFALGELAGGLKDFLAFAKDQLSLKHFSVTLANEQEENSNSAIRVFRVVVVLNETKNFYDKVKEIQDQLDLRECVVDLELSQSPSNSNSNSNSNEDAPVHFNANVSVDASNSFAELLSQISVVFYGLHRKNARPTAALKKKQEELAQMITGLSLLRRVKVAVSVDRLAEVCLQSFGDVPQLVAPATGRPSFNWHVIRHFLSSSLEKAFSDESIPSLVFDTLFALCASLGPLHSFSMQSAAHVYTARCAQLPLLALVPTRAELQAIAREKKEKDSEKFVKATKVLEKLKR